MVSFSIWGFQHKEKFYVKTMDQTNSTTMWKMDQSV